MCQCGGDSSGRYHRGSRACAHIHFELHATCLDLDGTCARDPSCRNGGLTQNLKQRSDRCLVADLMVMVGRGVDDGGWQWEVRVQDTSLEAVPVVQWRADVSLN